mgnify:CR=1 FL=1
MQVPGERHPIWTLATVIVVCALIGFIFWCGLVYNSPINIKDLVPLIVAALGIMGVDGVKRLMTAPPKDEAKEG